MTPDEVILLVAEQASKKGLPWHVENYSTVRAAAERLLRTMLIIPEQSPRALESKTREVPLYQRGVGYVR